MKAFMSDERVRPSEGFCHFRQPSIRGILTKVFKGKLLILFSLLSLFFSFVITSYPPILLPRKRPGEGEKG